MSAFGNVPSSYKKIDENGNEVTVVKTGAPKASPEEMFVRANNQVVDSRNAAIGGGLLWGTVAIAGAALFKYAPAIDQYLPAILNNLPITPTGSVGATALLGGLYEGFSTIKDNLSARGASIRNTKRHAQTLAEKGVYAGDLAGVKKTLTGRVQGLSRNDMKKLSATAAQNKLQNG